MATEQAFPSSPITETGGAVVTTPFQFVADQDTFLRVTSVCSVAGVVVAVQGRRIDQAGAIQPIVETHVPFTTRTTKRQDYGLGIGAILNVTVFASQGTPLIGQCYVMVQLLRNTGGTAVILGTLLAGYVTAVQALGFPGSPIQRSTDGEPPIELIAIGSLAAGTEIVAQVPAGARWEIVSLFGRLFCSAAVATRVPQLQFIDPVAGTMMFVEALTTLAASQIGAYTFAQNLPSVAGMFLVNNTPIPLGMKLTALQFLETIVAGFDAGDAWENVTLVVREWLEVN